MDEVGAVSLIRHAWHICHIRRPAERHSKRVVSGNECPFFKASPACFSGHSAFLGNGTPHSAMENVTWLSVSNGMFDDAITPTLISK